VRRTSSTYKLNLSLAAVPRFASGWVLRRVKIAEPILTRFRQRVVAGSGKHRNRQARLSTGDTGNRCSKIAEIVHKGITAACVAESSAIGRSVSAFTADREIHKTRIIARREFRKLAEFFFISRSKIVRYRTRFRIIGRYVSSRSRLSRPADLDRPFLDGAAGDHLSEIVDSMAIAGSRKQKRAGRLGKNSEQMEDDAFDVQHAADGNAQDRCSFATRELAVSR